MEKKSSLKSKHKMSQKVAERLVYIAESNPPTLTKWEKDLINDRLTAFQTYGSGAVITKSQEKQIDFLYLKVKAYNIGSVK